jgi:uncharacterized membrane protein
VEAIGIALMIIAVAVFYFILIDLPKIFVRHYEAKVEIENQHTQQLQLKLEQARVENDTVKQMTR